MEEPMGFNELTSSKFITFMERAFLCKDVPSRNTGVMIGNSFVNNIFLYQFGVFKDEDGFGNAIKLEDKYNVTGRVVLLTISNENVILHLGAAYSYRN